MMYPETYVVVGTQAGTQCAKSVTLPTGANELPSGYAVPVPLANVFQPAKTKLVRARDPVLVAKFTFAVDAATVLLGAVPAVFELPLYVIVEPQRANNVAFPVKT